MKYHTLFLLKTRKDVANNLLSAAVVIGALKGNMKAAIAFSCNSKTINSYEEIYCVPRRREDIRARNYNASLKLRKT